MQVILREDVDNVGLRGEVVDVAAGYARNYLLPRRLAEPASPGRARGRRHPVLANTAGRHAGAHFLTRPPGGLEPPRAAAGPIGKKNCWFCRMKIDEVDYKDANQLRRYISEKGKIRSRRITGACRRHQRQVAVAVKRAREMALLPYATT